MPAKKKYQIPDQAAYQLLRERTLTRNASSRKIRAEGRGFNHWCLSSLMETETDLAAFALAFERDDAEVAEHYRQALDAARMWFDAGKPWRPRPQPVDPKVTEVHSGGFTFEITEQLPRMAEIGWMEDWQIGAFSQALGMCLAFGTRADVTRASAVPEVAYRSPDVVADAVTFGITRAEKAWGLGCMDDVRAACNEVIKAPPPTGVPAKWAKSFVKSRAVPHAQAKALLALIDKKPAKFSAALDAVASAHKAEWARSGRSAGRFVSLNGLALARMAKSHGIETPDTPLIPTRLLPGAL